MIDIIGIVDCIIRNVILNKGLTFSRIPFKKLKYGLVDKVTCTLESTEKTDPIQVNKLMRIIC